MPRKKRNLQKLTNVDYSSRSNYFRTLERGFSMAERASGETEYQRERIELEVRRALDSGEAFRCSALNRNY